MSSLLEFEKDQVYLASEKLVIRNESENNSGALLELSDKAAFENSEEKVQLLEGHSYEYELEPECSLQIIPGVIKPRREKKYLGRISTGNYVGRLALEIIGPEKRIQTAVEVRSVKTDYRSDYRKMLGDIAEECTELLMTHSSPVAHRFTPDNKKDNKTLYQQFAFLKSILESAEFQEAVQRVVSMPVTVWRQKEKQIDTRRSKRISSSEIRQIASLPNRQPLPNSHRLRKNTGLESLPRQINTLINTDTVDSPENRFVKFALKEFQNFCGKFRRLVLENLESDEIPPHILYEADSLEHKLSEFLNNNIFREIKMPITLPINSPILQKKEGYRQILKSWMMYDLAARLTWDYLTDDDYHAGKRDVATLYEYWLFFKLLRLVEGIFNVEPKETKELIKLTNDGLGLQLKSGKYIHVNASFNHKNRDINIRFCYNKTFSSSDFPKSGSWTHAMRPDYTLSFWPKEFTLDEAEKQELVVHIHFDAKYKVNKDQYLFSEKPYLENIKNSEELFEEKNEQRFGTYKNADLLKMHSYKDAIRRTAGAYVIYPGEKKLNKKSFHEIIPGLGAFPVSPSKDEDCMKDVREFIYDVLDHYANRASQRENQSYHNYEIHQKEDSDVMHYVLPERLTNSGKRFTSMRETTVLVGYYNKRQYEWIERSCMYNIRVGSKNGLVQFKPEIFGARYLLLYGSNELKTEKIWEIISDSPKLVSRDELKELQYPTEPSAENYILFNLKPVVEGTFGNTAWDISKLPGYNEVSPPRKPFAESMVSLMKVAVPN